MRVRSTAHRGVKSYGVRVFSYRICAPGIPTNMYTLNGLRRITSPSRKSWKFGASPPYLSGISYYTRYLEEIDLVSERQNFFSAKSLHEKPSHRLPVSTLHSLEIRIIIVLQC